MKTKSLVIAAFGLGAALFTFAARAVEPAAPDTQPAVSANGDVAGLIDQLGADDFHIRLAAEQKLKAMGPSVFPALKEACNTRDPEIHARIDDILSVPEEVPQATAIGKQVLHASIENGKRIIDIQEPGRTIHIEQGAGGISMIITGQVGGEQVTRQYKARTCAQLQRDNPQACRLFQNFAGDGSSIDIIFQLNGAQARLNALKIANHMLGVNGGAIFTPAAHSQVKQVSTPLQNLQTLRDSLLREIKTGRISQNQEEVKN